jgi:DNA-binding CsgD family transcriptional regulator
MLSGTSCRCVPSCGRTVFSCSSRHQEALAAARQAEHENVHLSVWVLPELIEAAVRTGSEHLAGDALDLLAERARAGGTEDGLGIEARSRALLNEGEAAEGYYREAIGRLGRTRRRPELARAHLLYGEWLRRARRRAEAREQLRTAWQMLDAIGMAGFAGRARRELAATGETARMRTARKRTARTPPGQDSEPLTAQEAQVARLARDGLSNPEIGARLFISARTVQYHLAKVFAKLGISSRGQLYRVLPSDPDPVPPRQCPASKSASWKRTRGSRVTNCPRAGSRAAIGPSGCGKTSLVIYALTQDGTPDIPPGAVLLPLQDRALVGTGQAA